MSLAQPKDPDCERPPEFIYICLMDGRREKPSDANSTCTSESQASHGHAQLTDE